MIVVDASVVVLGVLENQTAWQMLADEDLHAPAVIDVEVVSALRRHTLRGGLDAKVALVALQGWGEMFVNRYFSNVDIPRMWELRENLTTADSSYVALAESLDCALVTADRRLAGAPGIRCPVTVITS